jgi:hypothetical protein
MRCRRVQSCGYPPAAGFAQCDVAATIGNTYARPSREGGVIDAAHLGLAVKRTCVIIMVKVRSNRPRLARRHAAGAQKLARVLSND